MTYPGVSSSNSPTGIPTLPDGTPDYGRAAGQAQTTVSGRVSIWDIPTGVDPNKPIWFDIGHGETNDPSLDLRTGKTSVNSSPTSTQILASPTKIMRQYAAMSANDPGSFLALQKLLASGPWGTVHENGAFDHSTEAALGNAMAQYLKLSHGAGVAMSFSEYLQKTAATAQALGGDGTSLGSGQQQPHITLADPAQIRDATQNAAQAALGRGLSAKELDKFVTEFQNQQIQNQTDTYVQQTKLPGEAMAFVQKENPQAFHDNQRAAFLDQLVNLLGGNLTRRPDQQPVAAVGGS